MNSKIKDGLPLKRKLIQLYAALLYNAHIKGYIKGNIFTGKTKVVCVPGLHCYSCPGAAFACPLGSLQNAIASSGHTAPYYMFGILLLFGITLGRTICGWLCPVGLVQEILYKLPTPKLKKSHVTRILSYLKYVILVVFVIIIPLCYAFRNVPLPAFCKYICPAGTLGGAVQLLSHPANADKFSMLGIFFTRKWAILSAVVLGSVFIYRVFCRFLCPLGAIYGLFNRFALVGIRVNDDKCIRCGKCTAHCPMDVKKVCDHECISCGKCIGVCPTGAISLRAGSKVLIDGAEKTAAKESASENAPKKTAGNRTARTITAAVMTVLLTGTMIYTNMPSKDTQMTQAVSTGSQVGQTLPDFSLTTTSEETFRLSEYRGKTVVINLWATWCTPCVNELPNFQKLQSAHPDDVKVLAIHSDMVTDDVKKYLSAYEYTFSFAIDETGEVISSLGGSTMLPQTIVINADGTVTYNLVGSVTYEKLEDLVGVAQKGDEIDEK